MDGIAAASPIVITPTVLQAQTQARLAQDQAQIATLENQVSSGVAVQVASDNPVQAANILGLQASVTRTSQYSTNAQDGLGWLTLANSTVSSVMNVLQQVQSSVQSISGAALTGTSTALTGIRTAVTGALNQLINLANAQYAGQAIFSGTGNPTQAYAATGTYLGAGTAPTRTVAPGTHVAVSVTGTQIFGTGATGLLSKVTTVKGTPGNLGVLQRIVNDLTKGAKGTATAVHRATTTDLSALQAAMSTVAAQAAKLGASQQAMQGYAGQATAASTALTQELSSTQDVNLAQAVTELQLQQTSYQAALYAASQLHTQSLVSYL